MISFIFIGLGIGLIVGVGLVHRHARRYPHSIYGEDLSQR